MKPYPKEMGPRHGAPVNTDKKLYDKRLKLIKNMVKTNVVEDFDASDPLKIGECPPVPISQDLSFTHVLCPMCLLLQENLWLVLVAFMESEDRVYVAWLPTRN